MIERPIGMKNKKISRGFTMIEMVFVIVVIGILSAIAIPKFAMTRNDAIVTKAKTTIAALRSAIGMEHQKQILRGDFNDINLSTAIGLLDYGLDSERWSTDTANNTLTFTAPDGKTCVFKLQNNRLTKQTCAVEGLNDL